MPFDIGIHFNNAVMLYITLICISCFIVFNDLLLAAYIYFRLWRWCPTKNKFEQFFFYSSSKWILKHQIQLATSTQLAQKLLTNVQSSGGSRSFAKETRALRMSRVVAGHQKLTTTNWEQSSKLILLQLHETECWLFYSQQFEVNWKGEKAQYVGAL